MDEVSCCKQRGEWGETMINSLAAAVKQNWKAPVDGWIAVNIDAATKNGKNAMALVARD